jgi:hypothetical protein
MPPVEVSSRTIAKIIVTDWWRNRRPDAVSLAGAPTVVVPDRGESPVSPAPPPG